MLLAGCDLIFELPHIAERPDARFDDAPLDALCIGNGLLAGLCVESGDPVMLTNAINTTIDSRCRKVPQDSGPELCVIDGSTIAVTEHVVVTGERVLVLLAANEVSITATLDASSIAGTRSGTAARTTCPSMTGENGTSGAGGGGGGTFGYIGGPGGAGQMGTATPAIGGAPASVMPQTAVVGGCSGGNGGITVGAAAAGAPGGGAIYIIAGARIHVAGAINASGGGGPGGGAKNGGGGGGSGGFIALDAPMLQIDGHVFARGGGGGGGGGTTSGGLPGRDPAADAPASGGLAGGGGSGGGDGCGTPNGTTGGITSSATAGGGGGGGGCGRIRLYGSRMGSGTFSPMPT